MCVHGLFFRKQSKPYKRLYREVLPLRLQFAAMETWRVVFSPPASGAWNMALDEAILDAVIANTAPPTLRFFAWEPPTLSLGIGQPATDADLVSLSRLGWGLVRRPTGGRAILHTDELTYSICAREDHPLAQGGILESYRRLSRGLLAGLNILGVDAQAEAERARGAAMAAGAVCFETPSSYEITSGGRKLIGSAQARMRGGVLQHGTLPLEGDLARILQALARPDTDTHHVHHRAVTLAEASGRIVSWRACADAIRSGFEQEFGIRLDETPLTGGEERRAEELVAEKYANERWTKRR
jgi:lipoyl(octanoyl) transferase